MDQKNKINLWYFALAFFGVVLLHDLWIGAQRIEPIPYSRFEQLVDDGLVDQVVIGSDRITGSFAVPQNGKTEFVTTRVEPGLAERLRDSGVTFTGAVENTWLGTVLSWVVPAAVFVGLWLLVIRKFAEKQGFGGMMSIGKSRAKVYVETDTKTRFEDVAGVEEAKAEL